MHCIGFSIHYYDLVDCVEDMAENDVFEWLELKATCANKTQCDYLFRGGSFLEECTVAGDVSYLQVYFMCQPGIYIFNYIFMQYCFLCHSNRLLV